MGSAERQLRSRNAAAVILVASGARAGLRFPLESDVTRIGRNADNDLVLSGADAAVVSGRHAEILRQGDSYRLVDNQSTNGTFVDGRRVSDAELRAPASIQLGSGGPVLEFTFERPAGHETGGLDRTVVVQPGAPANGNIAQSDAGLGAEHERALRGAVARARMARRTGVGDATMAIMREVLDSALRRTRSRFKRVIVALTLVIVGLAAYAGWKIHEYKGENAGIDARIRQLEAKLAKVSQGSAEAEQLATALGQYEDQAQALSKNLLYRIAIRDSGDFVTREIRILLAEFGAEVYSVPPGFVQEVNTYLRQYQGPDRPHMTRALGAARPAIHTIRQILEANHLPPDFAYIAVVESAMNRGGESSSGAAGLWQFTPATARAFGLRVSSERDERLDTAKATRAACKYIRDLILDFGSGSSVMLALAAYNSGPARVKQAIHRVSDPIKQRNFWYLYRIRALPEETREYVPKVFAAMIIGRHPEKFGF